MRYQLLTYSAVEGLAGLSLIDQVVVLGIVAVLPLAIGGATWRWVIAGLAVAVALPQDRGVGAAVLVLPLVGVAAGRTVALVRDVGPLLFWTRADAARILAGIYACVAAGALFQSRLGVRLFGIREPIVELTAVHYIYAGCGALVLAGYTASRRAVVCTAAAPPIVAFGFVTGCALPQVGGAVLMAAGVWLTAGLQLGEVLRGGQRGVRLLLGISGLAIWAPMVLAVAWAAGQHWDIPVLSIHDMARLHGLPNALAFVVAGLVARKVPKEGAPWRSLV